MSVQKYHTFTLERGTWVLVRTTDKQAFDELFAEMRRLIPGCAAESYRGGAFTRIHKLKGRDAEMGEYVRNWLLQNGWHLVTSGRPDSRYNDFEDTFRRPIAPAMLTSGRVPDIGDQLEKLANLHKSGALTDVEYQAAKRKLLGA